MARFPGFANSIEIAKGFDHVTDVEDSLQVVT